MAKVTISVAAVPLGAGRHFVAAWLAAEAGGEARTRGLGEVWVGGTREGLLRIASEALAALKRSCEVTLVTTRPDPHEAYPSDAAIADFTAARARHRVRIEVVAAGESCEALAAADRFAKARAAGVRTSPTGDAAPPAPERPGRLF